MRNRMPQESRRPWAWLIFDVRQRSMSRVHLLTVEDCFNVTGRGVILTPDFSVPQRAWQNQTESVTIVPPSGPEFETTAQFNLTHLSIRNPKVPLDKRWRILVMIIGTPKEQL